MKLGGLTLGTLRLYFAAELKNVKVNLIILREYVGVLNAAL